MSNLPICQKTPIFHSTSREVRDGGLFHINLISHLVVRDVCVFLHLFEKKLTNFQRPISSGLSIVTSINFEGPIRLGPSSDFLVVRNNERKQICGGFRCSFESFRSSTINTVTDFFLKYNLRKLNYEY